MEIQELRAFIGVGPDGSETGIVALDGLPMVLAGTAINPPALLERVRERMVELAGASGVAIREVVFKRDAVESLFPGGEA